MVSSIGAAAPASARRGRRRRACAADWTPPGAPAAPPGEATRAEISVSASASTMPPTSSVRCTTCTVPSSPASGKIRIDLEGVGAGPGRAADHQRRDALPVALDGRVLVGDLALPDPGPQLRRHVADRLADGQVRLRADPAGHHDRLEHARPWSPAAPVEPVGTADLGQRRGAAARAASWGRSRRRTGWSARSARALSISAVAASIFERSRPVVICCCRISPRITITTVDSASVSTTTRTSSERLQNTSRPGPDDRPDRARIKDQRGTAARSARRRRWDCSAHCDQLVSDRLPATQPRRRRRHPATGVTAGRRSRRAGPYPTPRTVTTTSGCSGSFSILDRSRCTCTLTSRVSAACR